MTKTQQMALDYVRRAGQVWTETAAAEFFEQLVQLEKAGRVVFVRRSDGRGHDVRVTVPR